MARLDTGWCVHPKVLALSVAGMAVHAWSISFCDLTRSDGVISEGSWPSKKGFAEGIKEVVKAGLWEPCEGGFLLHDYLKYNRPKAQIELEQAQSNERVQRWRNDRRNDQRNGASLAREGAPGPGPGPGETRSVSPVTPPTPSTTLAGGADGADGTSSRAAPRRKDDDDDVEVIHAEAGVCPLCRRVYTGTYLEHTAEKHRVNPEPVAPGNLGRSLRRHKGEPPPVAPTPEMEAEFAAMHQRLQELPPT